ncbi:MAG: hypothetical protein A3C47_05885 [Omnitrophica bacterium RIFCSPHIGHO2_02_FULL_51_18]|nr:MAG: hypothetical protein A3C47_05885 [Omnitrophica bacterium RIFCSPHIGHO2_02_FULL_51_18]
MQGVVVLTTAPDLKSANAIAKSLVTQKLAACVSVRSGFVSTYSWKGKIEKSNETVLLIKTLKKKFQGVKKAIRAMHPYELPEIIALPMVEVSKEYLSWMAEAVG